MWLSLGKELILGKIAILGLEVIGMTYATPFKKLATK